LAGGELSPEQVEAIKKKLGVDRQLQDKYVRVFTDTVGKEVLGDLMERFRYMGGEVAQDAFHTQKYAAQREVISWIITMSHMNYMDILERMKKKVNP